MFHYISFQFITQKNNILFFPVPVAGIVGSNEVYMKSGSDINISCVVTGHIKPVNIMWYHEMLEERKYHLEVNGFRRTLHARDSIFGKDFQKNPT